MSDNARINGLLDGKEEIRDFLNGVSDYKLKKFIEYGMPVKIIDGRWYAHRENIEKFFRIWTCEKILKVDEI